MNADLYAKPGRARWTWHGALIRLRRHEHAPFHPGNYEFWYCAWCRRALSHQPWTDGPEWVPYKPGLMWSGTVWHWTPPGAS